MFIGGLQIVHHKDHVIDLIKKIQAGKERELINMKVKSVLLDLEDDNVLALMYVLAAVAVKLTGPYWDLVTSGEVHYLHLYKPVEAMYKRVQEWLQDSDPLFDPAEVAVFRVST